MDHGMIQFEPTSRIADITVPDDVEMNWISAEQSNSSVIVGDIAIIKMFRRVTAGPHPEAEMSRYLTEQGFANTPALLGEVVRIDPDGTRHALVIAQAFVRNQGDAWTWTLDLLLRGLSDIAGGDEAAAADAARHADYVQFASLARPASRRDARRPGAAVRQSGLRPRDRDRPRQPPRSRSGRAPNWKPPIAQSMRPSSGRPPEEQDRATMQAVREALFNKLHALADMVDGATLTRIHGDLHLGQVLVVNGDVVHHRFRRRAGQAGRTAPRARTIRCAMSPA